MNIPRTPSRVRVLLVASCLAFLLLAPSLSQRAGAASVIRGTNWFPIGPAPIDPGYGGPATGRVSAIAVNPANPSDVWIGGASGGVWRSVNGGLDWTPMSDRTEALAVGDIRLADCIVSGCARVYVGTGEGSIRRDTLHGRGLLVGTATPDPLLPFSWTLRGQAEFDLASIVKVVLDPTTSGSLQRIYVAVSSGVTASSTESTVTAPAPPQGYGIYQSDNNGGSWTKLSIPGTSGAKPTDLEIDPQDSNLLWAGFLGKGIFKGVRSPGPNTFTWCPLDAGNGVAVCGGTSGSLPDSSVTTFDWVEIALHHPAGPNATLYALFGNCPDPICNSCAPTIYKSTNGGGHWTQKNAAAPPAYSRYTHVLTIDPANDDHLFYGAVGLWRSLNSADNFDSTGDSVDDDIMSVPFPNQLHPDQHGLVFADPGGGCTVQQCNVPGNNCTMYSANDGGVYVSTNSGCSWTARNTGLQLTGFQSIGASPLTPNVVGGTQDNGTSMFTGGSTWAIQAGADTSGTVIDLDNPLRMYSVTNAGPACSLVRAIEWTTTGGPPYLGSSTTSDDSSFYPMLVQDTTAPHPFYYGTNKLLKSTNDAAVFNDISPVLGGMTFQAELGRNNPITAVAVAPNNPDRIYLAYYDGQVYTSSAPCPMAGCWTSVGGAGHGLPAGVAVTWIAVDPGNDQIAYLGLAGFFSGAHLYKTTNAGGIWSPSAGAGLNALPSVPVDTIAVEPSEPLNVWAGIDGNLTRDTVWKSTDGGASWSAFSNGLPNVPVYQLSIVERDLGASGKVGQVFAGTHGRGAYVLTTPFLTNYEGWVNGSIWDIPVYGHGYLPGESCTMQVIQSDGTICAQGGIDARGGMIETDGDGRLVTSNGGFYIDQPVAWACFNGTCVNGTPIADCNDDANGDGIPDLISAVIVRCGGLTGIDNILGCPALNNPPTNILGLDTLIGSPVSAAASAGRTGVQAPAAGGKFHLMPAVQSGDGSSRTLCDVTVPFAAGDDDPTILQRAADLVNADAACQVAGVKAGVTKEPDGFEEDMFQPARLHLADPLVTGTQMVTTLMANPGEATDSCFDLEAIGVPVVGSILIMKVRFDTLPGGALGGGIRLVEHSPIGPCEIEVPTTPGWTAADVAANVQQALQAPGIPGPHPRCPARSNPRDTSFGDPAGRSLVSVLASGFTVCVNDPGIGVGIVLDETCFADADCNDFNPCTQERCDVVAHHCDRQPVPNGTACNDGNACTQGNACFGGLCGTPIVCNDQNFCTTDRCDPLSGRCVFRPTCDDGNPCTLDSCSPTAGQCLHQPAPGATCNDADPCTVQDVCVPSGSQASAVCHGTTVTCNDGDPCTVDRCDQGTGQCLRSPVVCNDGNSCTVDSCDHATGACRADPLSGPCDDGNPCTTDDRCSFIPGANSIACVGQQPSCSDGNLCTLDFCDADTGACSNPPLSCDDGRTCTADVCDKGTGICTHTAAGLGEVSPLDFADRVTFSWPATPPGVVLWNSYRGTIPPGLLGSRLPGAVYDHVCFESDNTFGDGPTTSTDRSDPPLGRAYYYDLTAENSCAEGPLGSATSGGARPNPFPCPTPP